MSVNSDELTRKQSLAVRALVANTSLEDAANQAGVSTRTIYRWRQQPHFVAALNRAISCEIGQTVTDLVGDMRNNRTVMLAIRDDDENAPSVRLRAAELIDDSLLRWRTVLDTEQRLTRLEDLLRE